MLKATIKNEVFSEFLGRLIAISDDAKIDVTEDGLSAKMIDPADVALISSKLSKDSFDSFEAKEFELGLDLVKINDYLSLAGKDTLLSFSIEENANKLSISYDGFSYGIALLDSSTIRKTPRIPELDLNAHANMPTREVLKIIKASEKIQSYLIVTIDEEQQSFKTLSSKDTQALVGEIDMEKLISAPTGKASSLYSVDYLSKIFKSIKHDEISIKMGTDMPMIIESCIDEYSSSIFMLAPRIEG